MSICVRRSYLFLLRIVVSNLVTMLGPHCVTRLDAANAQEHNAFMYCAEQQLLVNAGVW